MYQVSHLIQTVRQYGLKKTAQLVSQEITYVAVHNFLKGSYSQQYEDVVVESLFSPGKKGFFVDVGCHDPIRLNNTFRLYKKGWRGLNIDANPQYAAPYKIARPGDTFINGGVGEQSGVMTFYSFFPPALSTFSAKAAEEYRNAGHKILEELPIKVLPLRDILALYVKEEETIDFMNVDVEGLDLEVLKSNDWDKWRPRVLCVEVGASKKDIGIFLSSKGYTARFRNNTNTIFTLDTLGYVRNI